MKNTIAIGILGLVLVTNGAVAQTAVEQAQIVRDFDRSLVDYTQRHQRLHILPEAINAATPAPRVFTLPVAMVFRQLIAQAIVGRTADAAAIGGVGLAHRAVVLQPFPASELYDFPPVLAAALPALPAPLEYRLIANDLVIRDAEADVIVAVLRDALGVITTR